jgi:hypothetical protein
MTSGVDAVIDTVVPLCDTWRTCHGGGAGICGRNPCPAVHLHQVDIDKRQVGGTGVDINNICKPQFGQWA